MQQIGLDRLPLTVLAQPLEHPAAQAHQRRRTARRAVEAAEEFLSWRFGHGRQRSQRDGGRAGRVGLRRVEHCVRLRRELPRERLEQGVVFALGERFDLADDGLRDHR